MYCDKPEVFNKYVLQACESSDEKQKPILPGGLKNVSFDQNTGGTNDTESDQRQTNKEWFTSNLYYA